MSVAVTQRRRESLSDAVARARMQSLANRRCPRRVRQEVRDGMAVVVFSAAASTGLAVVLTLLAAVLG